MLFLLRFINKIEVQLNCQKLFAINPILMINSIWVIFIDLLMWFIIITKSSNALNSVIKALNIYFLVIKAKINTSYGIL